MKTLDTLLKDFEYEVVSGDTSAEITSIAYDSRKVENGSLFVCIKGATSDGHSYIESAVKSGAVAILCEDAPKDCPVAVIKTADTRKALALSSAAFFDYPAKKMTIIGLTGTKGKTTTSHMIKKILETAGKKVGMIGTNGAFIGNEHIVTNNTTPESHELQSLFFEMAKAGCSHVVMEVSSQALMLHRTYGIQFNYSAFLNISPDHISDSEHKDFEDYLSCKLKIFDQSDNSVIFKNTDHYDRVSAACKNFVTTSIDSDADYKASNVENFWNDTFFGLTFDIKGKFNDTIKLSMPGIFNAENAMIAIAICNELGISADAIKEGLADMHVKGRCQLVKEAGPATFIIDYAHNGFSFENILTMLKQYNPKRLICLYGAGGNRAKDRRYDMGEVAGKYADLSIVTADNPRFEKVSDICADIVTGINKSGGKYIVIEDRTEALKYAVDNFESGDIVACLGKGHEEYVEIEGVKSHYSEYEVLCDYMKTK